ncbi:DUF397 domain-containing protein [Streptomyces sp. TP-A0356]|uniref:DUF397 domain-containing protein n=1 Tax=Streptomyces sp. TP-A0356 TaxID=1359208 RepID=UPI0006E290D3|nr:DUF397 domain-containing protein [Streptomyces sp. TP-A0356]
MSTALEWFKSSYSSDQGGQCLEVACTDRESTHETAVHIRDSKNPTGPILQVTPATWAAFTAYAAR